MTGFDELMDDLMIEKKEENREKMNEKFEIYDRENILVEKGEKIRSMAVKRFFLLNMEKKL